MYIHCETSMHPTIIWKKVGGLRGGGVGGLYTQRFGGGWRTRNKVFVVYKCIFNEKCIYTQILFVYCLCFCFWFFIFGWGGGGGGGGLDD